MGESGMEDYALKTLTATNAASDGDSGPVSSARLVLVFEANRPLQSATYYDLRGIHTIRVGRGRGRAAERGNGILSIKVPDRWMSSRHAELHQLIGQWQLTDSGSRNGSLIDGQRVAIHQLRASDIIELGHTIFVLQRDCPPVLDDPDTTLSGELTDGWQGEFGPDDPALGGLRTLHPGLQGELAHAARLAKTPISFLIQGQSGTGKEVMARSLHALSGRTGPFVGVNTAALPEALVESELFGHKKGAFSGAISDSPGLIRSADGGTLFLDEIGDLPLPAQAVLLRVLQEREVRPVGDTRAIPVDIRLICATHKDLEERVERGEFRQDLYARIAGSVLTLPALRERRVDLGILIAALLPKVAKNARSLTFSMDAVRALFRHDWPMNIRELENCLLKAAALAGTGRVERSHLPRELGQYARASSGSPVADAPRSGTAGEHEGGGDANEPPTTPSAAQPTRKKVSVSKEDIEAALAANDYNIAHTAKALGLSRQALYRRMDRFSIPRPGDKSS